jgi:hypothetical protein
MSNFRVRTAKSGVTLPLTLRKARFFVIVLLGVLLAFSSSAEAQVVAGPAYNEFRLTLDVGTRKEAVGPLFFEEEQEDTIQWAFPPLMSYTHDRVLPSTEFDILYPFLTYDLFGKEYRFQIFQVFNFAGGVANEETNKHRFSLFPFYLQQRSKDNSLDYVSILPFYGKLQNRFFRDRVFYVMMPLYVESWKRDIHTVNYVFPIFHLRDGDGLRGWQFWPLVGHEHKAPTVQTNMWEDEIPVPGHDRKFVLWPFFLNQRAGLGGTNEEHTQAFIPLYSFTRSPLRDATAVPFILGWSSVHDRGKKYDEIGAPWPLVVFRKGESSRTRRIWPIYSRATNEFLESTWYLWPVYKYNRVHSDPLDRDRMRILLYLYSDTTERNTENNTARRRRELWPFYLYRQDWDGSSRLQVLAPLEPILPNNKSIERNYSPLWSIWRDEKNAKTGARSQSLLWNLYRRETKPDFSRTSAFFGLVQRAKTSDGSHWRWFYLPSKHFKSSSNREGSTPEGVRPE